MSLWVSLRKYGHRIFCFYLPMFHRVSRYNSLQANSFYRTNTVTTLIAIFSSSLSEEISALSVWCLNRICQTAQVATDLVKQNLVQLLLHSGLTSSPVVARSSAWCLGGLVHTDKLAESVLRLDAIPAIIHYLSKKVSLSESTSEDICAGVYVIARMSRSASLAKIIAKTRCIPFLAGQLEKSGDPQILRWTAQAIGCLLRPNSGDVAKVLLDAGIARGLARLPRLLPAEELEPLVAYAFAIQRFSCVWIGGVRNALVEAGIVESLLVALKTAANEPSPDVHIELALACTFLCDTCSRARKEMHNMGAIKVLQRIAAGGSPAVTKVCNTAITSISGNLMARNAGMCSYTCDVHCCREPVNSLIIS